MTDVEYVRGELLPCPFCGETPLVMITTRGSVVKCLGCGVKMERYKSGGHYKNLKTARRFTFNEIKDCWNRRYSQND